MSPKARMEYANRILRELPKMLPTLSIEHLLNRCEDSDDREEVWESIQAQADIRAREAIFAQLERVRVAATPASQERADAGKDAALTDERAKEIAQQVHAECSRIPGATFYNAAEMAIDAILAANKEKP
jgi:hypothetical protein